ncbi:putative LRR receptor-like serine/threonine-protein kinase [Rosa sericea]
MESIWFFLVFSCCMAASCLTMAAPQTNITTDQSALLALKAHITSDPHNLILTNWSTTTPVCNWVGVTCGARHLRATTLNLSYFGLEGTIPPQLGNLSFLVDIDLANNSFHGHLPKELARLCRLKFINFGNNSFMGTIPSWFGSLSKLQNFTLRGNHFSGSIPVAIFNLSALRIIDFRHNQLSGSIPREIGNLTMLKEIYLDYNNFIEIPNEISALDQLEKLYVQENVLEGDVPMVVFNMSSLITLTLFGNNLKGRLPDNMCQNLPQIQILNFGDNRLEGALPSIYWQCKQLVDLTLGGNKFSGSIPKNIGSATQLKQVNLAKNNLTGTIPDEIGHLPNLVMLYLGFNNLNGHIPTTIFNKSTLVTIELTSNQLSGNLPTNIGFGLPNLQDVFLFMNKLSGVIPKSISNASQLTRLELGENFLSGFIPSTLCALTNLEWLSLHENNLTLDTTIPKVNVLSCLANLKNLKHLAFSKNPLNANLPISFRNLSSSLQNVYLYNCNMRGTIPDDIGNLSSLIVLSMYENKLSGSIPTSMGTLKNLQALSLGDNNFQGHIPDELCQLQNLFMLGLYGNQLSGSIPSCLGHLATTLRTLALGSNLLNSTIPSTLWGLSDMLYLNLSSNNLSGSLSEAVGNMKVIIQIDLSNNHLSGSIPSSIGNLQSLVNLYLENNKFEGLIPNSLGKSLSLEILDLSINNLSGLIPKSLESLKYLKILNLSFNKLQGEIPTSGPFQNLSAQSFVSSGELCGESRFLVPSCNNSTFEAHLKYIIPGILSAMFIVTFIWIVILRRRKNVEAAKDITLLPQLLQRRVSHLELVRATNAFNESNLLGSGGFGSVYKGTFSDGIDVAIKVFNLQLEEAFKSFDIECEMLGNIRHRNLIKIISCCSQIDFKAVVLNYMPNGSLEKWLYSLNFSLNILQRLSIMIDVASALEYLHHGYGTPIVHCDLKPSNILLDKDMSAHVADFGIAKLLCGRGSMTRTITQATIGYMAPEYGMEGIVTRRGDVYSFGIVLMETFTRKKPTDEMFGDISLKQWVANSPLLDVVDANLLGTEEGDREFANKRECLSSIMRLALACSSESPEGRINMQEALATLNKIKIKFFKDAAAGGAVVLKHPLV